MAGCAAEGSGLAETTGGVLSAATRAAGVDIDVASAATANTATNRLMMARSTRVKGPGPCQVGASIPDASQPAPSAPELVRTCYAGAKVKLARENRTNRTASTIVNCHNRRSIPRRLR